MVIWPWLGLMVILLGVVRYLTSRYCRYFRLLFAIPASKAPRFIGHAFHFTRHPNEILDLMTTIFDTPTSNKNILAIWIGPLAAVFLRNIADIEKLLSSTTNLEKSINYHFLKPWLGQGLINSEGDIWHTHRKLITSSFHLKTLEGFLETMRNKLDTFFELMDEQVGKGYFNIEPYIANYSLDVISETAMSSTIDAQRKNSNFVDAIKSLTEIIILRSVSFWHYFGFLFWMSPYHALQKKSTTCVNNLISDIMERKRKQSKSAEINHSEVSNDIEEKKRLALLDLLFEAQSKNPKFTNQEILDEVNTFMFAGHDTTSSGMSFLLYLISKHQDVQEKVYNELMENIGNNKATHKELMCLKYLERVIKESLRLYPSVPYIGRKLKEDLELSGGFVLPGKCNVGIFIYNHHRNPGFWPDPDKFDPDRFSPDNSAERPPFAYIPFSAGPRNCIGQKFAMMEMMLTVTELLRRYRLIAEPGFEVHPVSHIVLRPGDEGVRLKLERRSARSADLKNF